MILQRLVQYYDRVAEDPNLEIDELGFAPQKISFAVVLEENGALHSIQDLRDSGEGSPRPRRMRGLPTLSGKRSSGIRAQFLWDKPEYLMGWTLDTKNRSRTADCHRAAIQLHEAVLDGTNSMVGRAVLRFFQDWNVSLLDETQEKALEDLSGGFGVFMIRGREGWLHEDPEMRERWIRHLEAQVDDSATTQCLVTGQEDIPARLHDPIKGVRGAQSSGAALVSFNGTAFTSYGHIQGRNAPVGRVTAFKYVAALNYLLHPENSHRASIGDATVVYWADRPATTIDGVEAEALFGWSLTGQEMAEDDLTVQEVRRAIRRLVRGEQTIVDSEARFFVLALSPNASRVSVRFWIEDSLGVMLDRIIEHQKRLEIDHGPRDRSPLSIMMLLRELGREVKDVPPVLAGSLARSILAGTRYPEAILAALIRRIRADRRINHPRAALTKAVLIRNYDRKVPIMLDENRKSVSYQLGRLFAILEKIQMDAAPGINSTIKDRYFSAASATPEAVFPRLLRLSQHHLRKLEPGRKVGAEKDIQAVMDKLDRLPRVLDLAGQGEFVLGYYHQKRDSFLTKAERESRANASATS